MGVRFPLQQNRPNIPEMRQAATGTQETLQSQNQERPARPTRADEQLNAQAIPTAGKQEEKPAFERLAQNAGSQTPGSIIDLLA
jgi:hypothetical protein